MAFVGASPKQTKPRRFDPRQVHARVVLASAPQLWIRLGADFAKQQGLPARTVNVLLGQGDYLGRLQLLFEPGATDAKPQHYKDGSIEYRVSVLGSWHLPQARPWQVLRRHEVLAPRRGEKKVLDLSLPDRWIEE